MYFEIDEQENAKDSYTLSVAEKGYIVLSITGLAAFCITLTVCCVQCRRKQSIEKEKTNTYMEHDKYQSRLKYRTGEKTTPKDRNYEHLLNVLPQTRPPTYQGQGNLNHDSSNSPRLSPAPIVPLTVSTPAYLYPRQQNPLNYQQQALDSASGMKSASSVANSFNSQQFYPYNNYAGYSVGNQNTPLIYNGMFSVDDPYGMSFVQHYHSNSLSGAPHWAPSSYTYYYNREQTQLQGYPPVSAQLLTVPNQPIRQTSALPATASNRSTLSKRTNRIAPIKPEDLSATLAKLSGTSETLPNRGTGSASIEPSRAASATSQKTAAADVRSINSRKEPKRSIGQETVSSIQNRTDGGKSSDSKKKRRKKRKSKEEKQKDETLYTVLRSSNYTRRQSQKEEDDIYYKDGTVLRVIDVYEDKDAKDRQLKM